jgi:hypothetical protein
MVYMSLAARTAMFTVAVLLLLQKAGAWPLNPEFTLPATGTIKYMLVINTTPLPKPPTKPPLYNNRPPWTFTGGTGTLMVASYSDAPPPIGPYNELVYIPGKYAPCANDQSKQYDSVARIWVDNRASLEVSCQLQWRWSSSSSSSRHVAQSTSPQA